MYLNTMWQMCYQFVCRYLHTIPSNPVSCKRTMAIKLCAYCRIACSECIYGQHKDDGWMDRFNACFQSNWIVKCYEHSSEISCSCHCFFSSHILPPTSYLVCPIYALCVTVALLVMCLCKVCAPLWGGQRSRGTDDFVTGVSVNIMADERHKRPKPHERKYAWR